MAIILCVGCGIKNIFVKDLSLFLDSPFCSECKKDFEDKISFQNEPSRLETAFIQGAKWWEFKSRGATMWQSDQEVALTEAKRRKENKTLGKHIFCLTCGFTGKMELRMYGREEYLECPKCGRQTP